MKSVSITIAIFAVLFISFIFFRDFLDKYHINHYNPLTGHYTIF